MKKEFVTVINCMDGRIQNCVNDYLQHKYDVLYVDVITEAGPNKIIADEIDLHTLNNIKKRLDISIHKHGSKVIAIVGHEDCAGNPSCRQQQYEDIRESVTYLMNLNYDVLILGLWVTLTGDVEVIDSSRSR